MKHERIRQIQIVTILFIFVGLLLFISISYLISVTNKNIIFIDDPYDIKDIGNVQQVQQLFHEEYKGISLSSDIDSFSKIKFYLNEIKFEKENYPFLTEIIFYRESERTCNGYFDDTDYIVIVFHCFEDSDVREYQIGKENIELFILAHELGHYYTLNQYEADDYAWELLLLNRLKEWKE